MAFLTTQHTFSRCIFVIYILTIPRREFERSTSLRDSVWKRRTWRPKVSHIFQNIGRENFGWEKSFELSFIHCFIPKAALCCLNKRLWSIFFQICSLRTTDATCYRRLHCCPSSWIYFNNCLSGSIWWSAFLFQDSLPRLSFCS